MSDQRWVGWLVAWLTVEKDHEGMQETMVENQ
jgi:hypothetical protein